MTGRRQCLGNPSATAAPGHGGAYGGRFSRGRTSAVTRAAVSVVWAHVTASGDRHAALQPVYDAVIDRWGELGGRRRSWSRPPWAYGGQPTASPPLARRLRRSVRRVSTLTIEVRSRCTAGRVGLESAAPSGHPLAVHTRPILDLRDFASGTSVTEGSLRTHPERLPDSAEGCVRTSFVTMLSAAVQPSRLHRRA